MTTAANITNAWVDRTLPDIFYEEPEPAEDAMLEDVALFRISCQLMEHYREREDLFICSRGKVFICYDRTNARAAPDLFIAFGVPAAAIRKNLPNYWMWETGKATDLVIEAASKSTAANDLGAKRRLYERLGITEYWRLDPSPNAESYGQLVSGDRLVVLHGYSPCARSCADSLAHGVGLRAMIWQGHWSVSGQDRFR